MAGYTSFRLESGATVYVKSSAAVPTVVGTGGIEQASGIADKARESWADGVDLVREVARDIVRQLADVTASVDEVTVEFGCNIAGKTGIILVEGEVGANLTVTLTWKGKGAGGAG